MNILIKIIKSDEDDTVDDLPEFSRVPKFRPRTSVSAEAYGVWNQKKEFVPPKYDKTSEQMQRLKSILKNSFLFSLLEDTDLNTVIYAMQEKVFIYLYLYIYVYTHIHIHTHGIGITAK
eukprot:GHVR01165887.1.p1 GENE.GHVR01165887.1~~GHVR01165887.1.p1  ORF type:complete len:119 (+),score=26.20 GHVR01165887.1:392-748(+)